MIMVFSKRHNYLSSTRTDYAAISSFKCRQSTFAYYNKPFYFRTSSFLKDQVSYPFRKRFSWIQSFPSRSGAHVILCQVPFNESKTSLKVLKIHTFSSIKKELFGYALATKFIPSVFLSRLQSVFLNEIENSGFLIYDYLGPPKVDQATTFQAFFEKSSSPFEISRHVAMLFRTALRFCYQTSGQFPFTLNRLLSTFEVFRKGSYISAVSAGFKHLYRKKVISDPSANIISIQFPFLTTKVSNPLLVLQKAKNINHIVFPGAYAKAAHCDLKPDNVLFVRKTSTEQIKPVIIDFVRFSKCVPLSIDFCKFEVGVIVTAMHSLLKSDHSLETIIEELKNYEKLINGDIIFDLNSELDCCTEKTFPIALKLAASIVSIIRQSYLNAVPKGAFDDRRFYFGTLLLTYLGYLSQPYVTQFSDFEKAFFLLLSTKIYERYFQ